MSLHGVVLHAVNMQLLHAVNMQHNRSLLHGDTWHALAMPSQCAAWCYAAHTTGSQAAAAAAGCGGGVGCEQASATPPAPAVATPEAAAVADATAGVAAAATAAAPCAPTSGTVLLAAASEDKVWMCGGLNCGKDGAVMCPGLKCGKDGGCEGLGFFYGSGAGFNRVSVPPI